MPALVLVRAGLLWYDSRMKKLYVEITNVCNLRCAFCPGTGRAPRFMSPGEFSLVLDRLSAERDAFLFLHLMGEPLLHPDLPELLAIAAAHDRRVCLVTNGTLLPERGAALLEAPALYRIAVSLHSAGGNGMDLNQTISYLENVWNFSVKAAKQGVIVALRLWNEGGAEAGNGAILDFLRRKTGQTAWPEPRRHSFRLGERLYLEREPAFDWPDPEGPERETRFCRALRDQLGVLSDGTVVPCCLDHEGALGLGSLFDRELSDILASPRAGALAEGFDRRQPAEPLCRRCGYAERFGR